MCDVKVMKRLLINVDAVPPICDYFKQKRFLWGVATTGNVMSKKLKEKCLRNAYEQLLGLPDINALMNRMSFSGKLMLFLATRSSNIISEASSCFQSFPGLERLVRKRGNRNNVCGVTYSATGINLPSHTWEKGPWPRSWHRPAS